MKSNSQILFDEIIDSLVDSGYDVCTACELAHETMREIKAYASGKHTIFAGDYKITFRIAAPAD